MQRDTKKDLAVGGTSVLAAAATGGEIAAIVAGVLTLVSLAYNTIAGRDIGRSERLFNRMAADDEDPDGFIDSVKQAVNDGDEEMLTKLRALIRADLESASDDAFEPIARIGHAYVQGACPAWVARAWVRLFSEVTTPELDVIRELAGNAHEAHRSAIEYRRRDSSQPMGVSVLLSAPEAWLPPRPLDGIPGLNVWPQFQSSSRPGNPERIGGGPDPIPIVRTPLAPRIFELLLQHGVASSRDDLIAHLRKHRITPVAGPIAQLSDEAAQAWRSPSGIASSPSRHLGPRLRSEGPREVLDLAQHRAERDAASGVAD